MADRTYYRYNHVISPETRFIHLMEAIEEAQLNLLLASLKGETFTIRVKVSLRYQVKDGKISIISLFL